MSFLPPNQNNQPATGTNLFGASNPSTTTGSVFGTSSGQNSTPGGLFGANNSNNSGSSSPFGSINPPSNQGTTNLFGVTKVGGNSNAATNPTNNATPSAGGSLFGTNANTTNNGTEAQKSNVFGGGVNLFGNQPAPATGGLFGGGGASGKTVSVFGPKPDNQSTIPSTIPKPSTSLFGAGSSSSTGTDSSGGFFGSTTPKPPDNASAAGQPAPSGGLFGSKPAEAPAASTSNTDVPSGGLFGSTAPKQAESSTTAGSNLFSGGLFGKKPDAPAPSTTTAPSTTSSSSLPFSLGGSSQASTSTTATQSAQPPALSTGFFSSALNKDSSGEKKDAAPATGSSFNLFGSSKPSTDKKDSTDASTPSLGLTKETDKSKIGLGTSPTPISAPPPSMLRGKTIEEIVNKWSADLDSQVREFSKFAAEVAVWDRALVENGNSLATLCNSMLAAEHEQNDIDQSLEHIEQQQRELLSTLEVYEKTTEETLGGQGASLRSLDTGPADNERDKNYMLATELHSHLDDLSSSLTQMIDAVNGLSLSSAQDASNGGDDPMTQIAQILSSHLESLQWIDGSVRELESSISEVEKRVREAGVTVNGTGLGNSSNFSRSRSFGLGR